MKKVYFLGIRKYNGITDFEEEIEAESKEEALEKIREQFPCLAFFPDDEILKNLHLIEDKD